MKQSSFSTNFPIAKCFNLDYVLHFYKPKKWLLLSKFQWQKYLVSIRKKIKVLHDNLPRVNECATMPSVNNVSTYKVNLDKLIKLRNFQTFLPFCVEDSSFLISLQVPDLLKKRS